MELGSGSWVYKSEDESCKHLRVLLYELVVSVNINLDVRGEFFGRELSILTEQVVGTEDHLEFSDGSGSGSPSILVVPLGDNCRDLKEFSGGVIKLVE